MLNSLLNPTTEGMMNFHFTFLVLIQVLVVFFSLHCETLPPDNFSSGCVRSPLYYSCIFRTILGSMMYTYAGSHMPLPLLEVWLFPLVEFRWQTTAST